MRICHEREVDVPVKSMFKVTEVVSDDMSMYTEATSVNTFIFNRNLNKITVFVCVGSADCRYVVGCSADGKNVSQTLSASRARSGSCRIRISNSKVEEVQSLNKENI
jgi:hypothetical protein